MPGILYLVPNTLGNPETSLTIPPGIASVVASTKIYIVENIRNARRYLKSLDREIDIDSLTFYELNEHTRADDIPRFLEPALAGKDSAVLSEAGVPGVADPGAVVVRLAHEKGIRVVPLTGPSSILLSLMSSGLNGQNFKFHGYLPVKQSERIRKIREMEQEIKKKGETQIFIETPYRNEALVKDILAACHPSLLLCIAADISLGTEFIETRTVKAWMNRKPSLHKRPAIFLLGT
jgi:16S rRNA (cytidine1402-2'-O)-methyltransferase